MDGGNQGAEDDLGTSSHFLPQHSHAPEYHAQQYHSHTQQYHHSHAHHHHDQDQQLLHNLQNPAYSDHPYADNSYADNSFRQTTSTPFPPVASRAEANLRAFAANDAAAAATSADAFLPPDSVNPDDFYRYYRGVQTATNATFLLPSPPLTTESMASAISSSSRQAAPSLRTNANGTTPKHPAAPADPNGPRPAFRSASNPVDDRLGSPNARSTSSASVAATAAAARNGYGGASQQSVRDLTKKFDQTTASSSSQPASIARKPTPRTRSARDAAASTNPETRPPGIGSNKSAYSTLRTTATREPASEATRASGPRPHQRAKYVAEDQLSTNSQSFASRISKPRNAIPPSTKAAEPMTHFSSSQASPEVSAPSPVAAGLDGLLFGEILPEYNDSVTAGFGIGGNRPRRTSESHIQNSRRPHQRSLSDTDLEPSSPTDWYRAASTTQDATSRNGETRLPRASSSGHGDLAAAPRITTHRFRHAPAAGRRSPYDTPSSPTSRLPRSVTRFSSASAQGSPASTRSNSPSSTKRSAAAGGRTPRQNGPPTASRARTPTSRSTTPTHTSGSTRKVPPHINTTPKSNNRLNAYVSAPPPKLSPPLRSSRPRQSVATATTTSSRMKSAETSHSSRKRGPRGTSNPEDGSSTRRQKISVGPIDFAQRRETIKLAYSKSIRESQAREARQAAAERRKKELEAVARAKAEAEAVARAAIAMQEDAENNSMQHTLAQRSRSGSEEPLKIATSLPFTPAQAPSNQAEGDLDSPTLGIPGSFPGLGPPPREDDEIPQSAVSVATAVTEFDNEPQTEPAVQGTDSRTMMGDDAGIPPPEEIVEEQPPPKLPPPHKRVSYQYPFDEDEGVSDERVSIKISLDPCSPQSSPQPTPAPPSFGLERSIPGSFQDEYDDESYAYSPHSYETTTTILAPEPDFTSSPVEAVTSVQSETYRAHVNADAPLNMPGHFQTDGDASPDVGHQADDMTRLEEFYVGPNLQDNIAALRGSTISSSDHDAFPDGQQSAGEVQRTPDTAHSLTVPILLSPGNRLSQASVWTDFSLGGSEDGDAAGRDSMVRSREADVRDQDSTKKASQTAPVMVSQDSSYEYIASCDEISPRDLDDVMSLIQPPAMDNRHRLPELDTGAGFSVPYLSSEPQKERLHSLDEAQRDDSYPLDKPQRDVAYLPSKPKSEDLSPLPPDHAPPPPPDEYQLDEGGYYIEPQTRPSSYLHSHDDESEYLTQPISTPHSIGELSLDAQESQAVIKAPSIEVQGQTDKEKKRLRQRQMVIKELIDTETAFVRDMSVVEEIYKGTAEACPELDTKTVKLIFRNTDEIIAFHTTFLVQLKEGVSNVYITKGRRSPLLRQDSTKDLKDSDAVTVNSTMSSGTSPVRMEPDDGKDRQTIIGPVFSKHMEEMRVTHEGYLRTSDLATKRLIQIQEDPTVKVWLNECNEVAKDLTAAWNLDSLLIKPMQRITKYPNLISQLLEHTPADHPDRQGLLAARIAVENAILDINKTKKNFELVGQIVGRKRKESDVRAGLARAFGKRVDKLQASSNRPAEDEEYLKLNEKFGDDYLRLQVVLRDVEYYTRTVSSYVHEFLQYLSSMELVMRLQPSKNHGHLESKWVQFNVGMRDIEKVLEQHLVSVRKDVIEPFEQVIKCYGNPSLAMKKRTKRRLDYEKYIQFKTSGKKVDKQLSELVEQYEALNETLKKELPKLSGLTAKIGNICLCKFVAIQTQWFAIWKEKVKVPLADASRIPETSEILATFQADFKMIEEEAMSIGILNPTLKGRSSQSTADDASSTFSKSRPRPSDLSIRGRGLSINSDSIPSLPTPDVLKRYSGGQFTLSPTIPSPGYSYYRDYYGGINGHSRGESSPAASEVQVGSRTAPAPVRPSTGRSIDSGGPARPSIDSTAQSSTYNRRDSGSTFNSQYAPPEPRRFSGVFHSALPLADNTEENPRSSRASSRERAAANSGYNILWLAASLFEFNIETTKHEAGYPYLTYQAGEIFDVIAEKGELWLAKNQDDPRDQVGWIWSKHFAKLADS